MTMRISSDNYVLEVNRSGQRLVLIADFERGAD